MLEFQARQTRAAAHLALAFPEDGRWAEHALHGFRYLREGMWDAEHGGWFWLLGRRGEPLAGGTKHAHSTAYAVQACAAVFRATGASEALALAEEGLRWFAARAHDCEHGGFHGWLRREGTVIRGPADVPAGANAVDPLGHGVGLKNVNVHGDWFEALLDLRAARPSAEVDAWIREFGALYVARLTTAAGEVHYTFRSDWTPEPGAERFGYAFQAAHRMVRAAPLLPDLPLEARAAALVERATRAAGVRGGGFCAAAPAAAPGLLRGTSPPDSRRIWWVQVEALRALAAVAAMPSLGQAEDLLRRQWTFIRTQMLDREFGGIYPACPRDLRVWNRPFGSLGRAKGLRKGDAWKDASHETDSLLTCISTLRGVESFR